MNKLRHIIFAFLTILWMGIIFYCSSFPAEESSEMSGAVDRVICRIFILHYDDMTPEEQEEAALELDHFVRKCAHATEYMILGFLISGTFYSEKRAKKVYYLFYFIIGVLYASSDEIHQLFIEGRAGRVTDVLIDSFGVIMGCLFFYILSNIVVKRKNNTKNPKVKKKK